MIALCPHGIAAGSWVRNSFAYLFGYVRPASSGRKRGYQTVRMTGKRGRVAGIATAAVFVGGMLLGTATPASAKSNDYACGNWKSGKHAWSASCIVWSGKARSETECYSAKKKKTYAQHGAWVGRGSWTFSGNCGKDRLVSLDTRWKR